MNFLYLTDVFCPWCYGFAPVMRRLVAEHPELPVRVLGGNLMDEPQTLTGMLEEYPTIREFFARLQETTGQSTEHFRQALERAAAGTGPDLLMHSPAMNLPLAALRHLAPGHQLEQMEAFQMAFYAQARDVMAAGEQAAIAAAWLPAGTPPDALTTAMADPAIQSAARHDAAEAEEVMGEFLLYPTLYLEHGGQRTLLEQVHPVANQADLLAMQKEVAGVFIHELMYRYIVDLAQASRKEPRLALGLSPRASLALAGMARAAAYLAGRDFVAPQEVTAVFADVARHRLVLADQAKAGGETVDVVIDDLLRTVPRPRPEKADRHGR